MILYLNVEYPLLHLIEIINRARTVDDTLIPN